MAWSSASIAFATAVAWFAAFVVAHLLGWRAGHGHARWLLVSYLLSVVGTLATAAGLTAAAWPASVLLVLLALMTSACLFVLYVPAVYTVLTSLSVETIIMLRRRGGAMSEDQLYDRFAGRSILEDRLATLVANGYLIREGARFRLSLRGRALAKAFAFIKAFWRLGPGG
jgi:hypothetical protein